MTSTRRELLRTGWKVGGALLFTCNGRGRAMFEEPDHDVANAGGHLLAISQKCPHLGCRVPFCDSSGRFECPCHGSKFDLGGEWIEGPAPRGMDRYDLRLESGALVVDTSKLVAGPNRGANQFLTPPKGPSCKTTA